MMAFDIIIIGGGPGGYVAAIRAAQLGAKVAVVEKDQLGGTCLNRGCIPTKALAAGAEIIHAVRKSPEFGVSTENLTVDVAKMMERKDQVVKRLVTGINYLFKKNKITLFAGTGKLVSVNEVEVSQHNGSVEMIMGKDIIIAAGSEPALIESLGYDGDLVITSNEALELKEVPAQLLIIGGGVIGCEFASIFAELGSEITIVDIMPSILPGVDKDVSRQLQSFFKRRGIKVKTGVAIKEVRKDQAGVTAILDGGEEISVDKILISIGRTLNSKGLGLETVGVETGPKGEVIVDARLRTNVPHIYAIGDITNKIQLAHLASAQGIAAVQNILGSHKEMNYDVVPSCIFTSPEIACVGITSQQAEETGMAVQTGKFPFMALGKAQAAGETDGFVKVIADKSNDKILGVHIIGPHATDLIAEAALAIKLGATIEQLTETIHAHPTLAEALLEAAEAVHGKSIHI